MARPSDYSPKIAFKICKRLASGESLRSICKSKELPSAVTVHNWLLDNKHPEFVKQYARARSIQAENLFDDLLEIADTSSTEIVGGKDSADNARVQARRLQVDTRKWYLSKVLPKKFGDKLDVTSGGEKLPQPLLHGLHHNDSDKKDSESK